MVPTAQRGPLRRRDWLWAPWGAVGLGPRPGRVTCPLCCFVATLLQALPRALDGQAAWWGTLRGAGQGPGGPASPPRLRAHPSAPLPGPPRLACPAGPRPSALTRTPAASRLSQQLPPKRPHRAATLSCPWATSGSVRADAGSPGQAHGVTAATPVERAATPSRQPRATGGGGVRPRRLQPTESRRIRGAQAGADPGCLRLASSPDGVRGAGPEGGRRAAALPGRGHALPASWLA